MRLVPGSRAPRRRPIAVAGLAALLVSASIVGVVWPAAASAGPLPAPPPRPAPAPVLPPSSGPAYAVATGKTAPAAAALPAGVAATCDVGAPTSLTTREEFTYRPRISAVLPAVGECTTVAGYFTVKDAATGTTVFTVSGTVPKNTAIGAQVALGRLRVGVRYTWSIHACFGAERCSTESAPQELIVNPWLGAGDRSTFTYDAFTVSTRTKAKVNVGTGNLLLTARGIAQVGATRSVEHGASYNSAGSQPGALYAGGILGPGWRSTSGTDHSVAYPEAGQLVYFDETGNAMGYTGSPAVGSPYTAPAGADATLVKNSDGTFTLTEHASGRKLSFNTLRHSTKDLTRNGTGVTYAYNADDIRAKTATSDAGTGYPVTFAYTGPAGQMSSMGQTAGSATRTVGYGYDASNRLHTITDAAGRLTTYDYDGSTGRVARIAGGNREVTLTYEPVLGRVATVTQDPAGLAAKTSYAYTDYATPQSDGALGEVRVTAPNDQGTSRVTTYRIDYAGRVLSTKDPLGHSRSRTYSVDAKVATSTDAAGTTTFTYGANGGESLTSISLPTGAAATLDYTGGTCTGSSGGTAYQPKCGSDFSGAKTVYTYNGPGNLTSAKDGSAAVASVAYNTDGTIASSTDPINQASANRTTYGYGTSGRQLLTLTPPTGNSLAARTFGYDGYGRLKTVKTGRGVTQLYGYDDVDELTSVDYSDTTPDVTTGYTADGDVLTRTDAAGTTRFSYDKLGRVTGKSTSGAVTCPTGPSSTQLCYRWDGNGNLTGAADARGTTTYGYDAANQLTSLVEGREGTRILFGYDDAGRRTDTWAKAGGTTAPPATFAMHQQVRYDGSGRITGTVVTRNSSDAAANEVLDQTLCYSAYSAGATSCAAGDTGRRAWLRDDNSGVATVYGYDAAGRLLSADRQDTGTDYRYCYDADGNITLRSTSSSAVNCATATGKLTYNSANQRTGSGAPVYDADGNVTSSPASAVPFDAAYDGADRMTTVTPPYPGALAATYAGTDSTERRSLGGTTYSVGQLGVQSETTSGTTRWFEQDPQGAGALAVSAGSAHGYLYTEVLGNVAGVVDAAGASAATYRYDPYGADASASGSFGNPYRYKGGYTDAATGLVKFGNRYYDPAAGRWTQQDSLTSLNDPAQGNRYAFAADDPVDNSDPSGKNLVCSGTFLTADLTTSTFLYGATELGLLTGGAGFLIGIGFTIGYFALEQATC